MLKLTLIIILIMLAAVVPVGATEVVLAAGTQISATNNAVIDSSVMAPGDDVNFTLSNDVKGASGMILKGSLIYGRVIEAAKFDGENAGSKLVIMFDFIQVGEDFYTMSAIIVSASDPQPGIQLKKSEEYEDTTAVTLKGADINIPVGTAFMIRVAKNIEK